MIANQKLQHRLLNLIELDHAKTMKLALKQKQYHKSHHYVANSAKERKQIISESKRELESLEERINEHKQSIQDADVKQIQCCQQIKKLKKKCADINEPIKHFGPTQYDRRIYAKKKLKMKILRMCTKARFIEIQSKSHNETIKGFTIDKNCAIYPFEEECSINSNNSTQVLWNQIKLSSQYIDVWSDLFSANPGKHRTTF